MDRRESLEGTRDRSDPEALALQRRRILELFGSLDWDPDYQYKAERRRRGGVAHPADPLEDEKS